jgi:glycosyltransferase involved in cell wall biosynthesis
VWPLLRILVFHGYLLGGTGSNVYNARLAAALTRAGHDVHLLCQERHPEGHAFVDAAGDWDTGSLVLEELARPARRVGSGRCTIYRPNIGELLPVYVADRYEGIEARPFADCTEQEISAYIEANVLAVEEVLELSDPELALANHAIMGPVILARALAGRVPYAVKIHGSALEYAVKPHPERFLQAAREGLAAAVAVLVGSRHTAVSLWEAIGESALPERTRLGPPGVEVEDFLPRERASAVAGLKALVPRLRATAERSTLGPAGNASAFDRDEAAAASAIARLDPEHEKLVAYVGKLIVSKGVDLLLASWPLVLAQVPNARLVVVGFGAYREGLERLIHALASGDLEQAREIALAGRALEADSSSHEPLKHLLAFLESLEGDERVLYLTAADSLVENVVLTGRLDHEELTELLPACEALVAPSTFPEAFGMVAAEAAACGVLPVVANHSGLAEVAGALSQAVQPEAAAWLSFDVGDGAVHDLADCLTGWLTVDAELRSSTRSGLVETVRERWSWDGVAAGVITAARGELDGLQRP